MTTAIEFNGVSFSYGNHPVLHDVRFSLPSQTISVLFGPSGSGKTTCLRLIAGFESSSSGNIFLLDQNADELNPNQRAVGYCFQEPALWHAVTVYDHIRLCMKNGTANDDAVQELLRDYHLQHVTRHFPSQLSGGEKKRLDFARAVASNPKILLLDEPLSSVEEPLRDELIKTIERCKAGGGSVVAVTHQKDELFTLAEHIVILQDGRVMNQGRPEDVYNNPQNQITARLIGLTNQFKVTFNNGVMHTPFGEVIPIKGESGEWMAGCSVYDFYCEENETGNARVESCVFHSGMYRITFVIDGQTFYAMSEMSFQPNQNISVKMKKVPVLIEG